MRIPSGVTDQVKNFVAVDSTDLTSRETGLSTFTVYRSRNGGTAAAMTTPTVTELDATNMPGVFTLLLDEDMSLAAGNDTEAMVFHITQAAMAPVTLEIELYRPPVTPGETLTVSSGVAEADMVAISGSTTAADKLEASAETIVIGAAVGGTLSTTQMSTDLTEVTNDHFVGGRLIWGDAPLTSQGTEITGYNGTTKVLTFVAVTDAPDAGDSFVIL